MEKNGISVDYIKDIKRKLDNVAIKGDRIFILHPDLCTPEALNYIQKQGIRIITDKDAVDVDCAIINPDSTVTAHYKKADQ